MSFRNKVQLIEDASTAAKEIFIPANNCFVIEVINEYALKDYITQYIATYSLF